MSICICALRAAVNSFSLLKRLIHLREKSIYLLGTCAKLRKAIVSFVISVCPQSVWNISPQFERILMNSDI